MPSKPIEHRTTHSFEETLETVLNAIAKAGMTVFAEIDHAKAALDNGLSMPQTRVVIYGNPKGGTPAMLGSPLTALDLPLKMLVRELPGNRSAIAFRPVAEDFESLGVKAEAAARFDELQRSVGDAACGSCPTRNQDKTAVSIER
ncbi:DUF302 domain-containing protein [Rhizobium leguminosarum]|uniref:DUF302 domain-containing protein n=1 Tax=Rhizobium leguminosarum TaxID=384 RepID=UPI001031E1EC|nr:DUF302 domain-containing protein [Rhizobium leguminosarum]TAX38944.1 DUF302 domain-containing protein [Rhizobium leguminosarum]